MFAENIQVKESKIERAKFDLDVSKIELHSAHKRKILLPYSGPLPDALQNNDGAVISIGITVNMRIGVSLIVTKGKAKTRCRIAATPQEINNILFPFFFQDKGKNSYPTNLDCGLAPYWLGNYQSSYIHWRRFVVEGHGVDDLIRQLPIQSLHWLVEYVNGYKESA